MHTYKGNKCYMKVIDLNTNPQRAMRKLVFLEADLIADLVLKGGWRKFMRPIEKQIADRLKEIADLAYRINTLCDDYMNYITTSNVFISYAVDEYGFTIEIKQLCDSSMKYIEFDNLERANEDFIKLKRKLEDLLEFKEMLITRVSKWRESGY